METQPEEMPDKFEAGTPNLPGIAGLNAAIKWINETGMSKIAAREKELGALLLEELFSLSKKTPLRLYGKRDMNGRLPVFSFNVIKGGGFYDNGELAGALSAAGYETRPGLHCAPLAHKTLGSFPEGSLRVSPGYFNTRGEIENFAKALRKAIRNI
jgi:selenocysteine lyase/cysteine desulfurase